VLVDQHFIKRGRIARMLPTLQREKLPIGLGVDEDSAIVVQGQRVRVLGSRGVLLLDMRQARQDAALGEFNLQGARLSWLEAGDQLDLRHLRLIPSPAKAAGRIVAPPPAGFRPYWRGPVFFADMLADFGVVQAMQQLVDSQRSEVRGLAFDALASDASAKPALGFEWVFTRDADTAAWNLGDAYSIAGVWLEVRPVQVARPLFTPFNPRR
jgi:cyanophycinase